MVQPKTRRLVTESALELFIDTQAATPVATIADLPAANASNMGLIRFVTAENEPYYSNGTTWSSIAQGAQGDPGPAGAGVPAGGEALQIIRKNSVGTTTEWATLTKSLVGLSNVDNTSDMNKPVSTTQKLALDEKLDTAALSYEVDPLNATLIGNQNSLTSNALSAAIVNEAMPVANVAKYGGIGNYNASTGGTDNYPAIMAAIAAAPPGGSVYLPGVLQSNGTGARYFCSQTIIVDKPVKIVSSGTHSTSDSPSSSLVFPAGVDGMRIVDNQNGRTASQWWLEGLFLESLSTSADGSVGLFASSGTGRIDSVSVHNFGGHGVHFRAGAELGGGNVNNSLLNRLRSYGNWGDGIRVEGTDAQSLLFLKPDVVANRGWGIHQVSGGATNQYIGAHFDQSYHGSPGAFRDNTMSTAWINVYVENGGENGGTIELGPNAAYGYISFSTYAGISKIVDNSLGSTMWIDDRKLGAKRENSGLVSKDGEHLYKTRVGVGGDPSIKLFYGGGNSALPSKEIYGYNRSADIFTFNTEVGPSSTAGEVDFGRAAYPWRNGHFSGYVKVGAFTTASRPSPSLSGAGAHIFDTTLGMPLWSNGTVWRDATGTAV